MRKAIVITVAFVLSALTACNAPKSGSVDGDDDVTSLGELTLTLAQVQEGSTARREAFPVLASAEEAEQLLAASPELQRFLAEEGQGWEISFDRRSGQPMLLQGPGIPWSSSLTQAIDHTEKSDRQSQQLAVTRRSEVLARQLLAKYPAMARGFEAADLTFDANWSGVLDDESQMMLVTLRSRSGQFEHLQGRLTFVIKHGNLIQIHSDRATKPTSAASAAITEQKALEGLKRRIEASDDLSMISTELKLVAMATTDEAPGVYTGEIGKGYHTRLAYIFRFTRPDDTKTYEAHVDAKSGKLLDLFDSNRYANVTGGIYSRGPEGSQEVVVPFENVAVSNNGSNVTTDLGGNFNYTSGTASTSLSGSFIRISDGCGAPAASTSAAPGDLLLGTSAATDCSFSTTGRSTRAARNAFYHLNHVRQIGKKWLDGVNSRATSWFGSNLAANVNLSQTCNAFWNGSSVNFFKSGTSGTLSCGNTGEIADVMQHEYGHGLDSNTKSGSVGDSAKGEAVSDGLALLLTHDHCMGPGFLLTAGRGETPECPSSVRDFKFRVTQADIASKCEKTGCRGALGYECHCESHILSGAYYDAAQAFVQRYGEDEGWHQWERAYVLAFANTTSYMPNSSGNAYAALLAADDDNGNVNDGTPNADLIFQAFSTAGIAGSQVPVKSACQTRPGAVTVTATSAAGKVNLSWSAVSGATAYTVLRRHVAGGTAGFMLINKNVTGTTYTDAEVDEGHQYQYVITGKAGSCTSPVSARATITVNGGGGGDVTPPHVAIASPTSGATLTGTVTFSANADDNVGVTKVELYVDGTLLATSTAAPWSTNWNTASAANGAHVLTAKAYDAAGNVGASAAVSVTTNNQNTGNVLTNKVPVTGLSGATGASVVYTMAVPAGASQLSFKLSGGTGDADIYVRFGQAPTTTAYDCRPFLTGNNETCDIPTAQSGTYFVMINGFAAYSGASLVGSYETGGGGNVLKNGVASSPADGAAGSSVLYTFEVPSTATSLNFAMVGTSGDADLYVRFGSAPTTTAYDCRPFLSTSNESCNNVGVKAGTWYVMVKGFSAYTGMTVKGTYAPQ